MPVFRNGGRAIDGEFEMKIALFVSEDYPESEFVSRYTDFLDKPDSGYIRLSNVIDVEFERLSVDKTKLVEEEINNLKKRIAELEAQK